MSKIAIIPARGGSKRIPSKNIKIFCGKPIIAYSIEAALSSNLFDDVMISTDDEQIADTAKKYGAKVPFMRTEKNADDFATTFDVLKEVLENYLTQHRHFDYGCCLYATAPFIDADLLQQAFNKLVNQKFHSVFPVVKYSYPIWRSLKIQNEKCEMWWPENLNKRSQDLQPAYHDAGQFYFFNVEKILSTGALFTNNSSAIIIDETHVQDIDTLSDWEIAELKYRHQQQKL